jgi:hypothetical protein
MEMMILQGVGKQSIMSRVGSSDCLQVGSSDCCLLHKPTISLTLMEANIGGKCIFLESICDDDDLLAGQRRTRQWRILIGKHREVLAVHVRLPISQPASILSKNKDGPHVSIINSKTYLLASTYTEYPARAYLHLKNKVVHQPLWYQFAYTSFDLPACYLT